LLDGADTIYSGAGQDQVFGDAGSDAIFGGARADFLLAGTGADTIYGGPGNDYVYLDKDKAVDTVTCGSGRMSSTAPPARTPLRPTVKRSMSGTRLAGVWRSGCSHLFARPPAASELVRDQVRRLR
jgi:hypothetical protein